MLYPLFRKISIFREKSQELFCPDPNVGAGEIFLTYSFHSYSMTSNFIPSDKNEALGERGEGNEDGI